MRRDRAVARAFLVLVVASLVVAAWIGLRDLDALLRLLRDPLSLQQSQALLAGLLSADLMVVQVLLLARLPWLERAWGRQALVRWHRVAAVWSAWLMVLHVLLFVVQRTTRSPGEVGGALWRLFVTDEWMVWASIGTGLVVLVMVSSLAWVRARLRYETWHLLHLWSYASIAFVLPHVLVSVDFTSTGVRAYWWTLYAVALAAVLWWRVGVPVWRSATHRLHVTDVRPEASGAVTVTVGGRALDRLGTRAGQFLVWRFRDGRGWTRGHPYSVSALPRDDRLRLTVAGRGDGAQRVAAVPVGTRVLVEGPYGSLGSLRRRRPGLLLVAAGVGVTPFRALLEDPGWPVGRTTLLLRVHDAATGVLLDELRPLCARRGVELVVLAGPRRSPLSWLPEGVDGGPAEVLSRLVPDLAARDVVVCGPPAWARAVRAAALRAGVAERDLHQEDFGW